MFCAWWLIKTNGEKGFSYWEIMNKLKNKDWHIFANHMLFSHSLNFTNNEKIWKAQKLVNHFSSSLWDAISGTTETRNLKANPSNSNVSWDPKIQVLSPQLGKIWLRRWVLHSAPGRQTGFCWTMTTCHSFVLPLTLMYNTLPFWKNPKPKVTI